MAVTLYTGKIGAGKSFEVVRSVILPALRSGRTVVANIDGLSVEKIGDYLRKGGCASPGLLVVVNKLDLRRADFFPRRLDDGSYAASSFVPLGALVVVDECPFYWGTDKSLLPDHLAFFREHRHIVGPDGIACDLVLISQTVDSVHRSLKGLVEFSMDCRKLNALGLEKKYTVVTYEGCKRSGRYILNRSTRSYDKRIFPLYKSFASSDGGRIVKTDARFSIWKNSGFWLCFIAAPVGALWGFHHVYESFFAGKLVHGGRVSGGGGAVDRAGRSAAAPPVSAAVRLRRSLHPALARSSWALVGSVSFSGQVFAVVQRSGFPLRYLPLSSCLLSMGQPIQCAAGGKLFLPSAGPSGGPSLIGSGSHG